MLIDLFYKRKKKINSRKKRGDCTRLWSTKVMITRVMGERKNWKGRGWIGPQRKAAIDLH